MQPITSRQREVLDYIAGFVDRNGYPPTLREIAGHLKVSGTLGVMKHLDALEQRGYLRRQSGSSRGIILAGRTAQTASIPVAGVVRAGLPQPAIEDIEDRLAIDCSLVKGGTFFLRVRGDSMINAAVMDGDLALVRPQATAENRDIVVAMVDGEATLKRFYRCEDHIRLQPENPGMEPIIVRNGEGEVAIVGKVVGIYRPLD
ncbi:transcriptional repressor LexA [Geobacter hydrogenophilus]|uniref:LexA repressor n=1 Tax=Geobacter hydrogenophilus TaxID=40983 RepID=A0A9W6G1M1_9BACT|nr:transcriptional repressor LexA [Geobacter hydrogenophilus]MBT0893296.1 transcriptional repressor LexA [Geobacter hydrogenophilus]GLI38856.1 LexA repressor 1 [Geobacter hydrogenophilus]